MANALRLFDTASRTVSDFEPLEDGKVSMYVCGATVQDEPHIGHARSAVAFDILYRWLELIGYKVTYVRNITDIDDKILSKAADEDSFYWEVAARNERAFSSSYAALGILPPSVEPRATGHIPEIIQMIRELISSGHAYESGGDVLFRVGSYPGYGQLSGQKADEMRGGADNIKEKEDPRDFALWKGSKEGEPFWETPWGDGRPGWHIECSAMSRKYLGKAFDIHGGGADLAFPHHENEIAQSRAQGDGFARTWMHNGWVTVKGVKMGKSLGNSLKVATLLGATRAIVLRYYLMSAQYRSNIEYSPEALKEAEAAVARIEGFLDRAAAHTKTEKIDKAVYGHLPEEFIAAMNDDLNSAAALAVIHEEVRLGNKALTEGSPEDVKAHLLAVSSAMSALGVSPWSPVFAKEESTQMSEVVEVLVAQLLAQRAGARVRGDWKEADKIRAELAEIGIALEDSKEGTSWSFAPAETEVSQPLPRKRKAERLAP